jgi:hypothetical protein
MSEEPQIIEMDPETAPRTTAFILLTCGLLGVGFLIVNVMFTGDDPYYIEREWKDGEEPVNQRYDIMPNLVRGKRVGEDSEEDAEAQDVPVIKKPKPTSNPWDHLLNKPTPVSPTVPGTPAAPSGVTPGGIKPPPGK